MRVIGGKARGIKLLTPDNKYLRPSLDRVKEALFNIIQDIVPASIVLDGFAGTGSLGIEALSRGADFCCFVEKNRQATVIINNNLKKTGLEEQARVYCCDFFLAVKRELKGKMFDIILLDPPYALMHTNILHAVKENELLAPDGIIVVERSSRDEELPCPEGIYLEDRRKYGDTALFFYK